MAELWFKAFRPIIKTPKVIWAAPKMTVIFIFREFMKLKPFLLTYQLGSTPNGYTQSSFY
jgi:hypothetical protein